MAAAQPVENYPVAPQMRRQFETGEGLLTPEQAGRDIWAALPPPPDTSLLLFGEMVREPA
jgi:benzil reductase ((S)-benzoin forming)